MLNYYRTIFLIIVFAIGFASCKKGPIEYIPNSDMVDILNEMFVIQGYMTTGYDRKLPEDSAKIISSLIESKGYDMALFDSTLHFLSNNPNHLKIIIDRVLDNMEITEQQLSLEDSLNNVQLTINARIQSQKLNWEIQMSKGDTLVIGKYKNKVQLPYQVYNNPATILTESSQYISKWFIAYNNKE